MSILLELDITDNDSGLTNSATLGADRVSPGGITLNIIGATVLTLESWHLQQ